MELIPEKIYPHFFVLGWLRHREDDVAAYWLGFIM